MSRSLIDRITPYHAANPPYPCVVERGRSAGRGECHFDFGWCSVKIVAVKRVAASPRSGGAES